MVMVPAAKHRGVPERDATLDAFTSTTDETEERPDEDDDASAEDGTASAEDGTDRALDRDDGAPDADHSQEASEESVVPPETATSTGVEQSAEVAVSTMAWAPDGVACEACGSSVERRWRTDAGFVCHSCVDWERTPNQ